MRFRDTISAEELERLDRRIETAALAALMDLRAQEDPEGTRQAVRDYLSEPLTAEERSIAAERGVTFPEGCSRLQALVSRHGEFKTDVDGPAPGSDDAIIHHLCDLVDALRQENELLKAQLAKPDGHE